MDLTTFRDIYTMETLTDMVNSIPEVPTMLSRYFGSEGIETTFAAIDIEEERLKLIPSTARGSEGPEPEAGSTEKTIVVKSAHLVQTGHITAQDVQDARQIGTDGLTTLDVKLSKIQRRLRNNMQATLEWHRVGAIKGKVLDADGVRVLHDIYDLFKVAPNDVQDVAWPSAVSGIVNPLVEQFNDLTDRVDLALGGTMYDGVSAIVGKSFWERLTTNPWVREAYNQWMMRQSAYGEHSKNEPFHYGGIDWIRYNKVVGDNVLVAPDEAHIFPVGEDIMKHYWTPSDEIAAANSMGQPYYSVSDIKRKRIDVEVQSNPITLCLFPKALFTLKSKAA